MHGLTGGSWKREQRSGHGHGEEQPHGKPPCGHQRLRALPPINATAPALDPPPSCRVVVCMMWPAIIG
jgi:hypothetical protein